MKSFRILLSRIFVKNGPKKVEVFTFDFLKNKNRMLKFSLFFPVVNLDNKATSGNCMLDFAFVHEL
jgi:hypothetical protein